MWAERRMQTCHACGSLCRPGGNVWQKEKKNWKPPLLDLWPQRSAHTAGNASHDVTSTFIIHAYIPHGTSRAHWLFIHERNIWPWNTHGYENLFFLLPITSKWRARAYICKATCAYNVYNNPPDVYSYAFFFFLKDCWSFLRAVYRGAVHMLYINMANVDRDAFRNTSSRTPTKQGNSNVSPPWSKKQSLHFTRLVSRSGHLEPVVSGHFLKGAAIGTAILWIKIKLKKKKTCGIPIRIGQPYPLPLCD